VHPFWIVIQTTVVVGQSCVFTLAGWALFCLVARLALFGSLTTKVCPIRPCCRIGCC